MTRLLYLLLICLPVAFTIWSCVPGGSCDGIPPIPLTSGTYTTASWSESDVRPIQATGTTKTMVVDVDAGTLVLTYANRADEAVVERWRLVRTKVNEYPGADETHF